MWKETINETKIQSSEWEKIFANEMTSQGLVSKIYNQLMHIRISIHTFWGNRKSQTTALATLYVLHKLISAFSILDLQDKVQ